MEKAKLKKKMVDLLCSAFDRRTSKHLAKIYFEDLLAINNTVTEADQDKLQLDVQRIIDGEPIQYVTGKAYFYDGYYCVNRHTLIPRPETEELCYWVIREQQDRGISLLDIGTGSGCIAITCQKNLPECRATALELSEEALKIAQKNALHHNSQIDFMLSDFLDKQVQERLSRYDVIVSNPPYILESERGLMGESTLRYEPNEALFPRGKDALVFYREIAEFGNTHLTVNGCIYLELNEFNAREVREIYLNAGYSKVEIKEDLQGKERMLKASFK